MKTPKPTSKAGLIINGIKAHYLKRYGYAWNPLNIGLSAYHKRATQLAAQYSKLELQTAINRLIDEHEQGLIY